MSWSLRFDEPIVLADGAELATLREAVVHLGRAIPKSEHSFEPGKFEDQYETALLDLINQKRAGKTITARERPRGENVVDLMDALRKSIGTAATARDPKPTKKPRKVASGQKEMLMPIAGKKVAKEVVAKRPATRPQRKSA